MSNCAKIITVIVLMTTWALTVQAGPCGGTCFFFSRWNTGGTDYAETTGATPCIDFANVGVAGLNCPVLNNIGGVCGGNGQFTVATTPVCRCCVSPLGKGQNWNAACAVIGVAMAMNLPNNCPG